jgi:hypothetical protein
VQYLLVLAVVAAGVYMITAPLRSARAASAGPGLAELEAARDAKYREIRDAELDLRTGKLSDEDFRAIDDTLRAEAVEILRELDLAVGTPAPAGELPSQP